MKYKTNISALLLAMLVFTASNGIAVFEHICSTSNTHSYSLFSSPTCENEQPLSPCCAKMELKKKKDCCEHKQFFSKLSVEGFTAKQMLLKPLEKQMNAECWPLLVSNHNQQNLEDFYSGLSPPDILHVYRIKSALQPSPSALQVFRC